MDQKILDALKTINEKLGGTNDANEKWGSLLQEIAENFEPSSGGGGTFLVTFDREGSGPLTADHTYGEIRDAVNAGKIVVFRNVSSGEDNYYSVNVVISFISYVNELGVVLYKVSAADYYSMEDGTEDDYPSME